jgi:hypothetical protein
MFGFDAFLGEWIEKFDPIECFYIINEEGMQVSSTVCKNVNTPRKHPLFRPAEKGADHSLKSYYYHLKILEKKEYLTEPYISLATGNICRTLSVSFPNDEGRSFILCIDFIV